MELGSEGREELRLFLEVRGQAGYGAGLGMYIEVVKAHIVSTAKVCTRTSGCSARGGADVSVSAGEVVLDGDAVVAQVAIDGSSGAVFVFVFEPFTSAKIYDSAAVTLDERGVDALRGHKVLAFDDFAAGGLGAGEARLGAVSGGMLRDVCSWMNLLTLFVWTADPDVIAHVDDQPRGFTRVSQEVCTAGWALRAFGVEGTVSILLVAGSAEGVIAVENEWINKGDVADRAHKVGVVVGHVVQRSKIDLGVFLSHIEAGQSMLNFYRLASDGGNWGSGARHSPSTACELGEESVDMWLNGTLFFHLVVKLEGSFLEGEEGCAQRGGHGGERGATRDNSIVTSSGAELSL